MWRRNGQTGNQSAAARPDDQPASGTFLGVLRIIQATLLTIGFALGALYVAGRIEGYFTSRSAIERFESAEPAMTAKGTQDTESNPQAVESQASETDFSDWGEGRIRAYVNAAKRAGGAPLAILHIPKIHLQAPVFDGTDGLTLNHAVGRIAGTAKPGEAGNVGLAAHRDGFFRGLKDIQTGDEIHLKTRSGIDVYTVDQIQIVSPRDVSVLRDHDRPAVTLVTCYPFYFVGNAPKRYVVTAFLTQPSTAGSKATDTRLNHQPINPALEEQ